MEEGGSAPVGPRIVVGADGSEPSLAAVEWAARQAGLTGATLEIVHANVVRAEFLDVLEATARTDRDILETAVARARRASPGVRVQGRAVDPPPAKALIAASTGADLLVVGSRGLGGFVGLLLGSVGQQCTTHAACPVVVVRSGS